MLLIGKIVLRVHDISLYYFLQFHVDLQLSHIKNVTKKYKKGFRELLSKNVIQTHLYDTNDP